jgi:hypothetical protein
MGDRRWAMVDERQVEDSPQSRQGRKGKGKDLKSVRYDIIQQILASFLILFAVKNPCLFLGALGVLAFQKSSPPRFPLRALRLCGSFKS